MDRAGWVATERRAPTVRMAPPTVATMLAEVAGAGATAKAEPSTTRERSRWTTTRHPRVPAGSPATRPSAGQDSLEAPAAPAAQAATAARAVTVAEAAPSPWLACSVAATKGAMPMTPVAAWTVPTGAEPAQRVAPGTEAAGPGVGCTTLGSSPLRPGAHRMGRSSTTMPRWAAPVDSAQQEPSGVWAVMAATGVSAARAGPKRRVVSPRSTGTTVMVATGVTVATARPAATGATAAMGATEPVVDCCRTPPFRCQDLHPSTRTTRSVPERVERVAAVAMEVRVGCPARADKAAVPSFPERAARRRARRANRASLDRTEQAGPQEAVVRTAAHSTPMFWLRRRGISTITLSPLTPTIAPGADETFVATGTYLDTSTLDLSTTATWTSTNPDVAVVGPGGVVTARSDGTTTVTATSGVLSASTVLTVAGAASPERTPDAPTLGTATAGPGCIAVPWTVPPDNGSSILGFTISTWSVDDATFSTTTLPAGAVGSPTDPSPGAIDHAEMCSLITGDHYEFAVAATNTVGTGGQSSWSPALTAAAATGLTIDTSTLPTALRLTPYSATLMATGGYTSYKWTLASGALPSGLKLSGAGALSGTPKSNGTSEFVVKVATSETATHPAVSTTAALTLTVQQPTPTITSVSPSAAAGEGGSKIAITGSGLESASAVMFGTVAATSYVANAAGTKITAVAPPESGDTVALSVTTPGGTATTSFEYLPPTVTTVSPGSGPGAGGTKVTIRGADLAGASSVLFGSTPATSYSINGAGTTMTALAPAHIAGVVTLAVTTPGGTANATFVFLGPTISATSPTNGSTAGGTKVTITGTDLNGTTSVEFGTAEAASFTVNAAGSKITAYSPPEGGGVVSLTVTTPGGSASVPYSY